MFVVGSHAIVNRYPPPIVFNPDGFKAEAFNIGDTTQRHQQCVGLEADDAAVFVLYRDVSFITEIAYGLNGVVNVKFYTLRNQCFHYHIGQFLIIVRQDLRRHIHHRYIGPEPAECLRHFDTDRPRAKNDHRLGQLIKVKYFFIGYIGRLVEAFDGGDDG